jgi:hypothetical protein
MPPRTSEPLDVQCRFRAAQPRGTQKEDTLAVHGMLAKFVLKSLN